VDAFINVKGVTLSPDGLRSELILSDIFRQRDEYINMSRIGATRVHVAINSEAETLIVLPGFSRLYFVLFAGEDERADSSSVFVIMPTQEHC
jgi:hypothetical protein